MKTLFLAPTRNGVGLSSTALGLTRALERQGLKVAFLKPIAQTYETRTDDSVHFARAVAHLTTPDPIALGRAEELLSQGGEEDLMEQVIALAREAAGGKQRRAGGRRAGAERTQRVRGHPQRAAGPQPGSRHGSGEQPRRGHRCRTRRRTGNRRAELPPQRRLGAGGLRAELRAA